MTNGLYCTVNILDLIDDVIEYETNDILSVVFT